MTQPPTTAQAEGCSISKLGGRATGWRVVRGAAVTLFVVVALSVSIRDRVCGQVRPDCGHAQLEAGRIYYCVAGRGPDVVVLNAGARLDSRTWGPIIAPLAAEATVITFDRLGLGQSGATSIARTPANIADELASLLAQIAPGPYVLVGHSAGGLHMMWFASEYPQQTRAVVLLDTPGPEFDRLRWELLTPGERLERQRLVATSRDQAPVGVQREYAGAEAAPLLRASAVPDTTLLVVVAANTHEFGPHGDPATHERLWQAGQRDWLAYSQRSRLVIAEGATHMVHRDRPNLVVRTVQEALRATAR